jgi:hypothetical protein
MYAQGEEKNSMSDSTHQSTPPHAGPPPSLLQRLGPTFGTAVGLLLGGLAGSGTGRLVGTEAAVTSGYALGAVGGGVLGSLLAWKYFNNTAK